MNLLAELSTSDLRRALALKEQIENLETQLAQLTGEAPARGKSPAREEAPAKRKLSPAHRRKLIKALARARLARWGGKAKKAAGKKSRKMSAAGRAALSAAAKARWARFRAAKS